MPQLWSYRPRATGGGQPRRKPQRVLQQHATAAVLQNTWTTTSMPERVLQRHATSGGQNRACPNGSYSVMPQLWSYGPRATGGGHTGSMPTRVLQQHATAAVLQASWPPVVGLQRVARKGLTALRHCSGQPDPQSPMVDNSARSTLTYMQSQNLSSEDKRQYM